VAEVVECLFCKHEALSSNSSPTKKKKKKKEVIMAPALEKLTSCGSRIVTGTFRVMGRGSNGLDRHGRAGTEHLAS
jgi:hypothetical protein